MPSIPESPDLPSRIPTWMGPTPTEAIQVDPELLESQLRVARMMSFGSLKDES